MQETDYWIDLTTVVDLGIDCVILCYAIETNLTNATLATIKAMAQRKDKQITDMLARINHEYFFRLFHQIAVPEYNVIEDLIFEYSSAVSPVDYFIVHINPSNLPSLITKYNLKNKLEVELGLI